MFDTLGIESIELEALTVDEVVKFFRTRTEHDLTNRKELEATRTLAEHMDGLPLALEQAAAYVVAMEMSFVRYLQLYNKQPLDVLQKKNPVTGKYPKSVATTWAMNIAQLGGAQRDVLRLSAFLAPKRIPLVIIEEGKPYLGNAIEQALENNPVHELLEPLHRFSLISMDTGEDTFGVHRLVQEVTKSELDAESEREWKRRAVQSLNAAFPWPETANWALCDHLVPHALVVSRLIDDLELRSEQACTLLGKAAYYLDDRALYELAEPLYRRALDITRKVLGEQHPEFATICNSLGELYRFTGRYEEAEPLCKRALEIRQEVLGEEHPEFAASCNNLALLYEATGRYEEAEPLYKQALEITRKLLGEEHSYFASSCNNLAALYRVTGRYKEAEPLYKQALEICVGSLGSDHPKTETIRGNYESFLKERSGE